MLNLLKKTEGLQSLRAGSHNKNALQIHSAYTFLMHCVSAYTFLMHFFYSCFFSLTVLGSSVFFFYAFYHVSIQSSAGKIRHVQLFFSGTDYTGMNYAIGNHKIYF